MKLLSFDELRSMGIRYSRVHLSRLVKAERFPRPVQLGAGRVAWVETEIHDWIAERAARRPAQHRAA